MSFRTPSDTIADLLAARADGDVAAATACYEPTATVVIEPGNIASGKEAIKGFTAATMSLPISFGNRCIIEAGDVALHLCEWTLRPAAGSEITGRTADILRRQLDGGWLLVLDNAWGVSLLDAAAA